MTQAANLAALGTNVSSSGIAQAAGGGTAGTAGVTGFKNRIINGAMVLDQRNAGASVTPASGVTYTLDRWHINASQSSKVSIQQDAGAVTPPAEFSDYLGATSTSAYTVLTGDYLSLRQSIEGYNIADLGWGTANAKTVTLSFWVRSSGLTYPATFGGTLNNSAYNRSYPFTYTISAANTWEYKTITIAGDTSGTWQTTTNTGVNVGFQLGTGSTFTGPAGSWSSNTYLGTTGATNIIATNGATLYITGAQFEVGTTATNFDVRSIGTELSLCYRYCWKYGGVANQYLNGPGLYADGNTIIFGSIPNPVSMRIAASLTVVGSPRVSSNGAPSTGWTPTISGPGGVLNSWIDMTKTGHGLTAGVTTNIYIPSTSDYFLFTAEL